MRRSLLYQAFYVFLICSLLSTSSLSIFAQDEYNIGAGGTISECEGILTDSNMGEDGFYGLNENYVVTICAPDAETFKISFPSGFTTEEGPDYLMIYEGTDTTGNIIGNSPYTGSLNPADILLLDIECITFQFVTDGNVFGAGFEIEWEVTLKGNPPLEDFTLWDVPCFSESFIIELTSPVLCSAVNPAAFVLSGPPVPPNIVNATPIDCDSEGFTTQIEIELDGEINKGGDYSIAFDYTYEDLCGDVFSSSGMAHFAVTDCPLNVEILPQNPVSCNGDCVELEAYVTGGNGIYTFVWSESSLGNNAIVEVCPPPSSYSVTVTDSFGASANASTTIDVYDLPDLGEPIIDLCRGYSLDLGTIASGGEWFWKNEKGELKTGYNFQALHGQFTPGNKWLYYVENDCADSIIVNILEIWAGWNEGFCTSNDPDYLMQGQPVGGVWSGNYVDPDGLFHPEVPGQHLITYTDPVTDCSHSKWVYVEDLTIELPAGIEPVMCESSPCFTFNVKPNAGQWDPHPGFEYVWNHVFCPGTAGIGIHTLYYNSDNGCRDSITVEITEIDAKGNKNGVIVYCPLEGIVNLPIGEPDGGTWHSTISTGTGGYNETDHTYNTGWNNENNATEFLVYSIGDCTDTLEVRIRKAKIAKDYFEFCPLNDTGFALNWENVKRSPNGGTWSGPGIVNENITNSPFDPSLAYEEGQFGDNWIYYDYKGCIDSMNMYLYEIEAGNDTTVCEIASPFKIEGAYPEGGWWEGQGMNQSGLFDPSVGPGQYEVSYHAIFGPDNNKQCFNTVTVTVEPIQEAIIEPVDEFFCYRDTLVNLTASPIGGTFTMKDSDGQDAPGLNGAVFNPKEAGEGAYIITYIYGKGECAVDDKIVLNVGAPLQVSVPVDTTICAGDGGFLKAAAAGGANTQYEYTWDQGIGFGANHLVNPLNETTYTVTVEDGCTEPVTASMTVFVAPAISYSIETSEIQCDGGTGFAEIITDPSFTIEWEDNDFSVNQNAVNAETGYYSAKITNPLTGCSEEVDINIPGYKAIQAGFSTNPNSENDCLKTLDFEFLDQSIGGESGYWDFGDGTTLAYGEKPVHSYAAPGNYQVKLYIENEGNCSSVATTDLCIDFRFDLLVPTAFSPNGDGLNDVFLADGMNVQAFHIKIYNRWGELLFESNHIDTGWDGLHDNLPAEIGVYTYEIIYNTQKYPEPRNRTGQVTLIR